MAKERCFVSMSIERRAPDAGSRSGVANNFANIENPVRLFLSLHSLFIFHFSPSSPLSSVEHVFAEQKDRMGLFIRTIGIARAKTKIGLANLVYNIKRLLFLRRIAAA